MSGSVLNAFHVSVIESSLGPYEVGLVPSRLDWQTEALVCKATWLLRTVLFDDVMCGWD